MGHATIFDMETHDPFLLAPIKPYVYCLLSTVYCLLSTVYCLLSTVYCLLSTVYCLLSTVYCLLSTVYCLQSNYLPRTFSTKAQAATTTKPAMTPITPLSNVGTIAVAIV